MHKKYLYIVLLLVVSALFTPIAIGIIKIKYAIENSSDTTNSFFEEELQSHAIDLFTENRNENSILTLEFKKKKYPFLRITNYFFTLKDILSPPPENI